MASSDLLKYASRSLAQTDFCFFAESPERLFGTSTSKSALFIDGQNLHRAVRR